MKKYYSIVFLTLGLTIVLAGEVKASIDSALSYYRKSRGDYKYFPVIAKELISEGLYFTAIPFIKEYMINSNRVHGPSLDNLIEIVTSQVGSKQFEVLPTRTLSKSRAPSIRYILAKKYFRERKYKKALSLLGGIIPLDHPIKPFSLMLRGSIYSITKRYSRSVDSYKRCITRSNSRLKELEDKNQIRQLEINRDYCIVGIPRAEFAAGKFKRANSSYLDLPKESHVWPEILFEEAWNSFYMRDYNRTLGKLVTYKAPFFTHLFNPEVDVLRALTYLEMCLWSDTKKTVDNFYSLYDKPTQEITKFLKNNRKNYKFYYHLAKRKINEDVRGNTLLNRLLDTVIRDPIYWDLYGSFLKGSKELKRIKNISNKAFRKILGKNIRDALLLQRNLIGAYVRKGIYIHQHLIKKSFEHMSYIKLEVLSRRKAELYRPVDAKRERGDIKYLKRNDKQYFWTFNGEFWADELGDYVFALRSECRG